MKGVEHEVRFAPPLRKLVLITTLALALIFSLVSVSHLSSPSASAQATSYDLCERTTVVRHEIIKALQYPNRDTRPTPDTFGTINASYPSATWGTLDTSAGDNTFGTYTSDPCTTPGATLTITAAALAADANWTHWSRQFDLQNKGLTELQAGDFEGLTNIWTIRIDGNSISEIADGFFDGNQVRNIQSHSGNVGLVPTCDWFGSEGPSVLELKFSFSGLTVYDIPPDAFDACADLTETAANDRSKLNQIQLRQRELGHVNLRWFANLTNLDWVRLGDSNIDTYYYSDDRFNRFTDGTKQTIGGQDYPARSAANANAIGTAIKAEIDRAFGSVVPTGTAGVGNAGRVSGTPFASYDICDWRDRPVSVRNEIIKGLQRVQPGIYGSSGTYRGPGNQYSGFGCASGQSGVVSKTNLAAHSSWIYPNWNTERFDLRNSGLEAIRPSYFKGLTQLELLDIRNNEISVIEDDSLAGIGVRELLLEGNKLGGKTVDPGEWFNNSCGTVHHLMLNKNRIRYQDIPFDAFDCFETRLWKLDLRSNPLGYLNIRWFQRLINLRWDLLLTDAPVVSYWNAASPVPVSATTYWAPETLRSAIRTAVTTWATSASKTVNSQAFTAAKYKAPSLGLDLCDRPRPIWADLMRELGYIYDEFDGRDSTDSWVGDVRHARWAHMRAGISRNGRILRAGDCVVMPATAILKSDLSTVDRATTAYNASQHAITVYDSSQFYSNGDSHLVLDLAGAEGLVDANGALDPAHWDNLHYVSRISLGGTGIREIPSETFADNPHLRYLYLNDNGLDNPDFTGAGGSFIEELDRLRILDLSRNLLTEFDADWLNPAAKSSANDPLFSLTLSGNPLRTLDLSGLTRVTSLRIDDTQLTSFDPAIFAMDDLVHLYWESDTMTLAGLHESGFNTFLSELPESIRDFQPPRWLGNPNHFEGAELDSDAAAASVAMYDWMRARNAADAGDDLVRVVSLNDPCRPDVSDVRSVSSWASDYGVLCLTNEQRNAFVSAVSEFNALYWVQSQNANLNDGQMGTLLDGISDQIMNRIDLTSNPSAFGAGFDTSKLSNFSNTRWVNLWQLRLANTGINFQQVNTILRNLADGAYGSANVLRVNDQVINRSAGLRDLDLSYNSGLFTGVNPSQLSEFLTGLTEVGTFADRLKLRLAGTDLNFDQFKAIIDSIETHRESASQNAYIVSELDVSGNPNLWNRWDSATRSWNNVPPDEIEDLMGRFSGLTSLDVGGTELSGTELGRVFAGLAAACPTSACLGGDAPITRLNSLGLSGIDLSDVSGVLPGRFDASNALAGLFGQLEPDLATRRSPLTSLDLSDTGISLTHLQRIADGLGDADALETLAELDLSGNPGIFAGCSPGLNIQSSIPGVPAITDASEALLKRFTNLRDLNLEGSVGSFTELQCVTNGLDGADGTDSDGTKTVTDIDVSNNPKAFTVPATDDAPESRASTQAVVVVFEALPSARKVLVNTGLTAQQARAVLNAVTEGQTPAQRRQSEVQFAAQNPAFTFKTPLPEDFTVESGRGSLRVRFTHNPMRDGEAFTVLRYEFRYRVRPADTSAAWGTTGGEAWRTASISLDTTGEKTFIIYALEPETIYQVQLRATSLALPNVATQTTGTWTRLPEINSIEPAITEVSVRAGDTIRLEVDVYGLSNIVDNGLPDVDGSKLIFTWSDNPGGGGFADPGDSRRVLYTAPSLPGTYTVRVEAQPDGICRDHHKTTFDISDEDRAACIAMFTVRVARAAVDPDPPAEPVNPAGLIPTSLTDEAGTAYAVFTPVEGGTFTGEGVTVTAAKGAVPDGELLGVAASVSPIAVPAPTPGARLTLSGSFYDINGVQRNGEAPVSGYRLDDPLTVCLPLPAAFRANVSDIVIASRSDDGSLGILSSKLRQTGGALSVCGSVGQLPATVAVAKTGIVEAPPEPMDPTTGEPPDTGGSAPGVSFALLALWFGFALVAGLAAVALAGSSIRRRGHGVG